MKTLAQAKACTKCGVPKPLDHFYLVKGRYESQCKDCRNAARRHRDHVRYTTVSDITPEQELAMRKKARKCLLCSVKLTDKPGLPNSKHLDHILPLGQGGTHTHGNCRIICRTCNLSRPKDGSDFTGQLTLWAQVPAVAVRRDGRKDGGNANKGTCRKGLHPWIPANIKVTAAGKKLCEPCYRAKESNKQHPRRQCKCGAMFPAPGATLMCPPCTDGAARKAAELHATGLSWVQVAAQVGYGTAEGARYAAKRIGYSPPPGLAAAKARAKAQPRPPRLCPDCGKPRPEQAPGRKGPAQCQPCAEARAWRAVEMRRRGMTLEEIGARLGYASKSSVTNLMKTVVPVEARMGRPVSR